jgi:molybdopterin synthase sulfur carrier subunit
MTTVYIKYFASVREAMGTGTETLDTSATTLAELRDALIARGGAGGAALARGMAVRLALNQVMVDEATPLKEGCEVAFFPPVTGG